MSLQDFLEKLENVEKREAEAKKERLAALEKFSPLKIGEIPKASVTPKIGEDTPNWYSFLVFFLKMKPRQGVMRIPIEYIRDATTALDTLSRDLKLGSHFRTRFETSEGKVTHLLVDRERE